MSDQGLRQIALEKARGIVFLPEHMLEELIVRVVNGIVQGGRVHLSCQQSILKTSVKGIVP